MRRAPFLMIALLVATATARGETRPGPAAGIPPVMINSVAAGGIEQSLVLAPAPAATGRKTDADPFQAFAALRLPVSAQPLDFRFAASPDTAAVPARLRFRLEGWDDDWRDVDGRMWVALRFLDEAGRQISGVALPRTGESPGWTGDPSTARFRTVTETVVAPRRSRKVQVELNSGPPQATGIWLIKRVRVMAALGAEEPQHVLLEDHIDQGDDLQERQGVPSDWRREGANTGAPQVFSFATSPPTHALALIDTDVSSSGRWVSTRRNIVDVEPGRPVRIELEEAYSIGGGSAFTGTYHHLPAGHYTFRVIPADEFGHQAGLGEELPLILVPPFYASWWFWLLIALGLVGGLVGAVRYFTWKRLQRELERSERRRLVEQERIRIARDIHDDMGARLTQISLVSNLALRHTEPQSANYVQLKRLDQTVREVTSSLDEIVWAVDPAHDTLEGFCNYISQYITECVEGSPLRCRLEIPTLLPPRFLSSRTRHHLLLAVKEAVANALKHSGGSEVRVHLAFAEPTLTIAIADNGRGFDLATKPPGNGLGNMRARLVDLGGTCTIGPAAGGGTCVTFTLHLPAAAEST